MNLDVGVDSVYHLLGSVTDVLTAKIVLMKKIVSYRLILPAKPLIVAFAVGAIVVMIVW